MFAFSSSSLSFEVEDGVSSSAFEDGLRGVDVVLVDDPFWALPPFCCCPSSALDVLGEDPEGARASDSTLVEVDSLRLKASLLPSSLERDPGARGGGIYAGASEPDNQGLFEGMTGSNGISVIEEDCLLCSSLDKTTSSSPPFSLLVEGDATVDEGSSRENASLLASSLDKDTAPGTRGGGI